MAGIDEAGRGPLAGPVVAAALLVPDPRCAAFPEGTDDSKTLHPDSRESLFAALAPRFEWRIGIASVNEVDRLNVLEATMLAIRRAVRALPTLPAMVLIDGNRVPDDLGCAGRAVVGGDGRCMSVAAASIVAKVTRDRIMERLAAEHPEFGWERNRGYATPAHRRAIREWGVTPHHRRSFGTVRAVLNENPKAPDRHRHRGPAAPPSSSQ